MPFVPIASSGSLATHLHEATVHCGTAGGAEGRPSLLLVLSVGTCPFCRPQNIYGTTLVYRLQYSTLNAEINTREESERRLSRRVRETIHYIALGVRLCFDAIEYCC